MKSQIILFFFSVVLTIYSLINVFIYKHAALLLRENSISKKVFVFFFIIVSFSYFIYRIVGRYYPGINCNILGQIGSIWFALMVYLFILLLAFDVIYLTIKLINPSFLISVFKNPMLKYQLGGIIFGVLFIYTAYGFYNASHAKIKEIEVVSDKVLNREYSFIYVSDLHINDLFFPKAVDKLVQVINKNKVDFVLFGGDVFTEDVAHLSYHDSGEHFKNIRSEFGVYTVFGNHEYIGGLESAKNHFNSYGIKILADNRVMINEEIRLIGRDDISSENYFNRKRKELRELIDNDAKAKFTILVDHQPLSYKEGKELPINLFLSGHTHHGQLFPFSLFTKRIFDNSWGLKIEGNKYYYTSSGYGFWGPPVRTGNYPEIIIFKVKSKGR